MAMNEICNTYLWGILTFSEAIYQTVIWLHNMHGTTAVNKRQNLLAVRTLAQALECFEGH